MQRVRLSRGIFVAAAFVAASARAAAIDTFETPGSVTGPVGGAVASQVAENVPGALGRTRTLQATGVVPDGAVTVAVGGGSLFYSQTAGQQGSGGVDWETFTGPMIDFTTAVDLTAGGTVDAFQIQVLEQSIGAAARIGLQSACPLVGSCVALSFRGIDLQGPGTYTIPFADFIAVPGGFAPADFRQVVSVGLVVSSSFGAAPGSLRLGAFSTVPEPSAAALLLALGGFGARRWYRLAEWKFAGIRAAAAP